MLQIHGVRRLSRAVGLLSDGAGGWTLKTIIGSESELEPSEGRPLCLLLKPQF